MAKTCDNCKHWEQGSGPWRRCLSDHIVRVEMGGQIPPQAALDSVIVDESDSKGFASIYCGPLHSCPRWTEDNR